MQRCRFLGNRHVTLPLETRTFVRVALELQSLADLTAVEAGECLFRLGTLIRRDNADGIRNALD